jgi:hypothetical protein
VSAAPQILTRAEQPDVAIRGQVGMAGIGAFAVRTPEVYAWLGAHGLQPAGPPAPAGGDGDVVAGVLPGGRYATVTHVGHPSDTELAFRLAG